MQKNISVYLIYWKYS